MEKLIEIEPWFHDLEDRYVDKELLDLARWYIYLRSRRKCSTY